jgi:radical SAM protein with 4Fe4S-binding SPASM domain
VIDESKLYNLMSINLGAFAEPFLNPDFKSMVQYARSANILDIRVITNGLLLEDYIDFILDEQITNIFISVDASSESTYGKIRGNGFNRVVENILSLVEKRQLKNLLLPLIRVSFVKFDINAHEVDSFIKYWSQYVDFIDIQPGENLSHPSTNKIYSDKRFDCVAPWQRVSILSSGDILPCCSFYGRYLPIGNINETSIKQAWDSELMSSIRRNLVSNTENVCDICQRSLLPQ